MTWSDLASAAKKALMFPIPSILKNIKSLKELDRDMEPYVKSCLLEDLSQWDHAECGDARDRIFALLSISSDGGGFPVDYSVDAETVCYQVAKRIAETYKVGPLIALLVYAAASAKEGRHSTLPSWVPDWTRPTRVIIPKIEDLTTQNLAHQQVNALNNPQRLIAVVRQDRRLCLTGWLFPACRCETSLENPLCDRCYPDAALGTSAMPTILPGLDRSEYLACCCSNCVSLSFRRTKLLQPGEEPTIPAALILCYLQDSMVVFLLSSRGEEAAPDIPIYRLERCFPSNGPPHWILAGGNVWRHQQVMIE